MAADSEGKPREEPSVLVASPAEYQLAFGNGSLPRGSSNNSYSEEKRVEGGKTNSAEEANRYVVQHLSLWLGFAAGAIRYLLKNREGDGRD